jgi:hypothetical protein
VELVTNAIRHISAAAYESMLSEFQAAGGLLTTTEAITK